MMVVFSILRTGGIVLLVAVIVAAAVLLIPARYSFDGDIDGGRYLFRLSWFFRAVRFQFEYGEKMSAVLRILFVRLDLTDPEKAEKRKQRREKKAAKKKKKQRKKREKQRRAREKERMKHRGEMSSGAESSARELPEGEAAARAAGTAEAEAEAAGIRIPEKVRKIIRIARALYESEALGAVLPRLQIFLLRIRPRQLRGQVSFGFSDPAATGQVLGVISLIPFLFASELAVSPDFDAEKNYVSGNLFIWGRIHAIHLVIFALQVILDKRMRGFLSAVRGKKKK